MDQKLDSPDERGTSVTAVKGVRRNLYCGPMIDTSAQYQHALKLADNGTDVAFHIHPYDYRCVPVKSEPSIDWCWSNYGTASEADTD
jgi:hypothetical protein